MLLRKFCGCCLILLFVVNPRAAAQTPQTVTYQEASTPVRVSAQPSRSITEDSGCVFNRVTGLLRLTDGTFVVANSGNTELCFIDSSNRLVRKAGRSGTGPGEYRHIRSITQLRGDTIVVQDGLLRRLTVLTAVGAVVRTIDLAPPQGLGSVAIVEAAGDNQILVGYSEFISGPPQREPLLIHIKVLRYNTDGKLQGEAGRYLNSEHFAQQVPQNMGNVAYWDRAFGRRLSLIGTSNGFFAGDGATPEIRHHSWSGSVLAAHRLGIAPRQVRSSDIADYKRTSLAGAQPAERPIAEKRVEEMPYPQSFPAYRRFLDDRASRLWVERYPAPNETANAWLVFDRNTRQFSSVTLASGFRPMLVTQQMICGVRRDELDVESIACYSITR